MSIVRVDWRVQVLEQYLRFTSPPTSTQWRGPTWNGMGFLKLQSSSPVPTQHASSNKATPLNLSQTVALTGD